MRQGVRIEFQIAVVYAVVRLAKLAVLKDALEAAVSLVVYGACVGLGEVLLLVVVTMHLRLLTICR